MELVQNGHVNEVLKQYKINCKDVALKRNDNCLPILHEFLIDGDLRSTQIFSELIRKTDDCERAREIMMSSIDLICRSKELIKIFGWFLYHQEEDRINI